MNPDALASRQRGCGEGCGESVVHIGIQELSEERFPRGAEQNGSIADAKLIDRAE